MLRYAITILNQSLTKQVRAEHVHVGTDLFGLFLSVSRSKLGPIHSFRELSENSSQLT